MSVIKYASCILITSNKSSLSKLQTLIMKCSLPILGIKSYKYSTYEIRAELKWNTMYSMIMKESMTLIYKSVFENKPWAITDFFTFSLKSSANIRSCCKPIIKDIPKAKIMNKTLLFNGLNLYNLLDDDIKFKNPKLFPKYINKDISNIFPSDNILRYDPR